MTTVEDLSGAWRLRSGYGDVVPATVPGCVHTDLMAAGRLPDPFLDDNETAVAWVGREDWTYERDVAWHGPEHDRIDLVFDGLDTVARVELGGVTLGETRNMHRSYRYDVTELLDGPMPLSVHFTSAYTEAERVRGEVGTRPGSYPEPYQYVRKMACSFGWDWGPTLVTAGIWRQVRLEGWSTARLSNVHPLCTYMENSGHIDLVVEVERVAEDPLTVQVLIDGREIAAVEPGRHTLLVDGVAPWAPRGYGEPNLYTLTVILRQGQEELDRWERRTGFRTAAIDTSPDDAGTRFAIEVNGEPVLVKGVNWIPDDIFPSRMTRERTRMRRGSARATTSTR